MTRLLDPDAPLRSLRAAAAGPGARDGMLSPADLARAKGCKPPTVHDAERSGGRISVDVLRAYVEALGGTLEIRVTLPDGKSTSSRK